MKLLTTFFLLIFTSCVTVPTPYPTSTPYPTNTPYPTSTPYPTPQFGERFLSVVQERLSVDDTIPQAGRDSVIALLVNQPGYAFTDGHGIILQYNVFEVPKEPDLRKTAALLIGTGVVVGGQEQVPLDGIEVVFYANEREPWLALALAPPWDMAGDLRLAPLHRDYIKRLLDAGVITPTPAVVY